MTLTTCGSFGDKVNFIWSVADLLRGDFRQSYWEVFAEVAPQARKGNGALYSALAGPLERFNDDLGDEAQEQFRGDLDGYVRAYSFLSQIVSWSDTGLEKLYVFAKSLVANLPKRPGDASLGLGSEVELTHLRLELRGQLDASLATTDPIDDPLHAITGGGSGASDPEKERLSAIVSRLNERHGLNLSLTDALLFEQFKGDWTTDPDIAAAAKVNSFENFMIVFAKKFLTTGFARMDANTDIFKAINDDKAFAEDLKNSYGKETYDHFRAA